MSTDKNESKMAPKLKSEYNNVKELIEDLSVHFDFFKTMFVQINKDYEKLISVKKEFPQKYLLNDDFEDLMLKASHAKHVALTTNKLAMGLSEEMDTKYEFFKSHFEIHIADDELKALNFNKVTDSLRESYINTHKEMIATINSNERKEKEFFKEKNRVKFIVWKRKII